MNEQEELAHLHTPASDPKQRMIDYWGRRAEKAEAEIGRLRALAKALADDLESELRGHYFINGEIHPAEERRFERDMANVYEARRALEEKI
jgi:hypothetical protein